jgi:cytochrome P450
MAEADRPDDILQSLIESNSQSDLGASNQMMARLMLNLSLVAVMTTTVQATNVFNSLAAMPDFVAELRDEVRDVLAACNGEFSSTALREMKKLDSFVKESLRVYPDSCSEWFQALVAQWADQIYPGSVLPA